MSLVRPRFSLFCALLIAALVADEVARAGVAALPTFTEAPADPEPREDEPPADTEASELQPVRYKVRKQPRYPKKAKRMELEGHCRARVHIDTRGHIVEVTIEDADSGDCPPIFQRAVLDAASNWRFYPQTRDGVPIETVFVQPVEFRLK